MLPIDAAAQMYSALLLLGLSGDVPASDTVTSLLKVLCLQLRTSSEKLSLTSCINLCYAMLVAPPTSADHPVDAFNLLNRCISSSHTFSKAERTLLLFIHGALELLPWNRCAVEGMGKLKPIMYTSVDDECAGLPAACYVAAASHLAPHVEEREPAFLQNDTSSRVGVESAAIGSPSSSSSISSTGKRSDDEIDNWKFQSVSKWQGTFVASEIHEALCDLSSALDSCGIRHILAMDDGIEPHVSAQHCEILRRAGYSDKKTDRTIAFMWGSSVHYIGNSECIAELHLSPTARFQVALLQQKRCVQVVVVPHWWWPRNASCEQKCEALVGLVAD